MPIKSATRNEPPAEKNGSGMPVIGMMDTVMPMFSKRWVKITTRHAEDHQRRKRIASACRAMRTSEKQESQQETEREQHTCKAKLLADHGEDEIVRPLRDVPGALLRSLREPGPEPAAGADCHASTRIAWNAASLRYGSGSMNDTIRAR